MAIDRFTREQFEAALPVDRKTPDLIPLWAGLGLVQGEYCYTVPINENTGIFIRSSIRADGFAADTAKDSIRMYIVDENGRPLAKKRQAYTTRVPGWADRMTKQLRTMWKLAHYLRMCPACGVKRPFLATVKDKGKQTYGHEYVKCSCGKYFEWVKL